jgi:CheY-like chemotaxis protein
MYSTTILLVQPQIDSSLALRGRLEGKGYSVVEAKDASTAMSIINSSEIALVVTELYLPIGESRCLAQDIGNSPSLRRTKVLAYTSHGKRRDRQWARRIGADGYVITRSGEERFLEVVDHLMATPSITRRNAGGSRGVV